MPTKRKATTATNRGKAEQMVFAELLRYKMAHDGLSPTPQDLARALKLTPNTVNYQLNHLVTLGKIAMPDDDPTRITITGARWLPPGEPDPRPFHVRRDVAELEAENARLRDWLATASMSWKTYQDRAQLLDTLNTRKAQRIERLEQEVALWKIKAELFYKLSITTGRALARAQTGTTAAQAGNGNTAGNGIVRRSLVAAPA